MDKLNFPLCWCNLVNHISKPQSDASVSNSSAFSTLYFPMVGSLMWPRVRLEGLMVPSSSSTKEAISQAYRIEEWTLCTCHLIVQRQQVSP